MLTESLSLIHQRRRMCVQLQHLFRKLATSVQSTSIISSSNKSKSLPPANIALSTSEGTPDDSSDVQRDESTSLTAGIKAGVAIRSCLVADRTPLHSGIVHRRRKHAACGGWWLEKQRSIVTDKSSLARHRTFCCRVANGREACKNWASTTNELSSAVLRRCKRCPAEAYDELARNAIYSHVGLVSGATVEVVQFGVVVDKRSGSWGQGYHLWSV